MADVTNESGLRERIERKIKQRIAICGDQPNGDVYRAAMHEAFALVSDLLSTHEGSGWRGIETAPRDGTPFLAYNRMVGVYNTAFTTHWPGFGSADYEGFPCGFWSMLGAWDCQPTHWMPLPPAPSVTPNHPTEGEGK